MAVDRNILKQLEDKGRRTVETLQRRFGLDFAEERTWPQTSYRPVTDSNGLNLYPKHKTKGFLPPVSIPTGAEGEVSVPGGYKFKDWRGYLITDDINTTSDSTKEKFDKGMSDARSDSDLLDSPYSTRDIYSIFGDNSTDYFRHGLHVIDNLTPIENPKSGSSTLRLDNSNGTPFEQNDPVIFGFDIIIDDVTSPLLNGSVLDFLRNYNNVSEISSRIPVYEDFKQQFIKFFKTKSTVDINADSTTISKMRQPSAPEAPTRDNFFQDMNKKAYMNYYLKKIAGLDKLIEQNTPSAKKFLVEYNKDIISLSFSEDVTLSMGTLAHLYKLLYWSKPNGKGIVPENLLRFNCDIIVSEVRNYKRVIKFLDKIDKGEDIIGPPTDRPRTREMLKVIKDNVSRYVYSLRECQFYFNTLPHGADIDMGGSPTPFTEGGYTIQFDYKYSTVKLERFVPKLDGSGEGQYVGYDGGAIWRIGSPGARESRQDPSIDTSRFFTIGENKFNQNGINAPFVLEIPQQMTSRRPESETPATPKNLFERFKKRSIERAKQLGKTILNTAIASATRELQTAVNTRVALLNRSLNKILESKLDTSRIAPPRNIYTDSVQNSKGKIFYDVRADLLNFVGSSFGTQLGRSTQTIVTPAVPFTERRVATTLHLEQIRKIGNIASRRSYGGNVFQSVEQPFSGVSFPSNEKRPNYTGSLEFKRSTKTEERSNFGSNVFQSKQQPGSNVGFPNYAQKYPAPIYVSSGADDVAPGTFIIGPGNFLITG